MEESRLIRCVTSDMGDHVGAWQRGGKGTRIKTPFYVHPERQIIAVIAEGRAGTRKAYLGTENVETEGATERGAEPFRFSKPTIRPGEFLVSLRYPRE